jgi:hypothetical protein
VDNKHLIVALIARAIVHLNFDEPEKATSVLFDALTEMNFQPTVQRLLTEKGESTDGNATAAA